MSELAQTILAFIESRQPDASQFEPLALVLFCHQYHHNAAYRRYCDGLGIRSDQVQRWDAIPAVPAIAFKRFDLSCEPPERVPVVFHSSGTTHFSPSRHFMSEDSLTLYRASLIKGFEHYVLPDDARLPLWALMAPYAETPHSSLSFMLQTLMEAYGGLDHRWFTPRGERGKQSEIRKPKTDTERLDAQRSTPLSLALHELAHPVVLFGTAFAFLHFFDGTPERFRLPEGSRVVETGGFKGRSREVSREELYALFLERLGVPPTHCLSEYGMSEMGSQFYETTLRDHMFGIQREPRKSGVPWCRTRIEDPQTGKEVSIGERGLLVHYDLANFNSVLAIRTEDVGVRLEEGFHLLGRAPGAELRGCSLVWER